MKYKYKLLYPDGDYEISDEVYDTEDEATEAALYACSCFAEGGEIMSDMGDMDDDIVSGECDYRIIEIDD